MANRDKDLLLKALGFFQDRYASLAQDLRQRQSALGNGPEAEAESFALARLALIYENEVQRAMTVRTEIERTWKPQSLAELGAERIVAPQLSGHVPKNRK